VICPGGGYQLVVASDEGSAVAMAFNKIGVTAFVLKYRLPNELIMNDKTIGPLQDAQMAIRTIREHAKEWNLHADKIGIVGLSAGGHLASTTGTHFATPVIDNPGKTSLRPDFMVLIYPVITFGPEGAPRTRTNLIGKDPPEELIGFFSSEKHVTPATPPTFLVHATDDHSFL
jgi:acetyl esterase/lipase